MPTTNPAKLSQENVAPHHSLLEADFPFDQVSEVARADRYCNDKTYAVHKWWARRPPAVIRAVLLAAILPGDTSNEDFWKAFGSAHDALDGKVVGDPFMGGATSLVEASRLGANVTGVDVDPLAVRTARVELQAFDGAVFRDEAMALLADLRRDLSDLYPGQADEPLHYFRLREAACGACGCSSLIYRNLWLVRDRGLRGAVVREEGGVAFCPLCRGLHHIDVDRKVIDCCGKRLPLDAGTYAKGQYKCPQCRKVASNDALHVGNLPSRLIAVEETVKSAYRRVRAPASLDDEALQRAAELFKSASGPMDADLDGVDSGRPESYGFEKVGDLFHPRQSVVLAAAFDWIDERDLSAPVKDALRLAISNAVGSNNVLCGYATDYGRLSAIFSGVRAYSMPVLSVELNPLHESAGRGTLAATLRRVARSSDDEVARHTFDPMSGAPVRHIFPTRGDGRRLIRCGSADRALPNELGQYDIVLTDPPYFDFIPYSDLSLLYRAWLAPDSTLEELGGAPIFPVGDDPVTAFATRLGRAFANVATALQTGAPMIFTFHSAHERAWVALERALRASNFSVHSMFPVWADGRGGSHGHLGNCEWDLVFVCRQGAAPSGSFDVAPERWASRLAGQRLEEADKRSMAMALEMARRLCA